jgi:polysaccharide export outer membrane protein
MARRPTGSSLLLALPLALSCGALAIAAAGCHSSLPPYDYRAEPDPRRSEFQVGPLDMLRVEVWKNRELSADVTVRPDGIITLPLIGDVRAAGRTPTEIQKEVASRYGDYVRAEEGGIVSVAVVQVNSYYFTVAGNVEHAGLFTSKSYVTAVEAVAMAGGPNKYAGDSLFIVRGAPPRRIPIDLPRATSGESPEQNLVVLRGDVIYVP